MNTRSKLIAAVLGLAVAAGAIGDASAATIGKTVATHTVVTKSAKLVAPKLHRFHVGTRVLGTRVLKTRIVGAPVVKHLRIVHRAPILGTKQVVRVSKRPIFEKQAFLHRLIVKKTVIR